MDDIRQRLEFGNRTVKIQALRKLYETVLTKHRSALPINGSTPESAELSLLWEKCADSDAVVCQGACDQVVVLVHQQQAELGFVLSRLITLASVARNHTGIVNAVGHLLLLQTTSAPPVDSHKTILSSSVKYVCPFTISAPGMPHPLITLLVSQTDCWHVLLQLIERLFATVDHSRLLLMLEPFIKFVLLDPNQPSKHRPLQLALWSVFMRNICKNKQLVPYLVNLIPAMQVNASSDNFLKLLGCQMLTDGFCDEPILNVFISQVLVMALSLADDGTDISELMRTMHEIIASQKVELDCNLLLLQCVPLLSSSTLRSLPFCLNIVHEIISMANEAGRPRLDRLVVAVLVLPVLQILSSPDLYNSGKVLSTAAAILDAVESYFEQRTSLSRDCDRGAENLFSYPTPDGYTHQAIISVIHNLCKRPSVVSIWLRNVDFSMSKEASSPPFLISCLIAAVLVTHNASDILEQSLNVLVKLCTKDLTLSVQVLPLLLYKLSKTHEPKLRLEILRAIPRCATHKMAIGPVLATIQTLSAHPKLRAISLRLVSLLWQQQERCFMYLLQMLESSMSVDGSRSGGGGPDDVLLARASCVRDICQLSPTKHGEEMISHLSAILLDCTLPQQAPAACQALQALHHLIEAEVTDIRTVWNVLGTKLSQEQRPLVLADVVKLLSLVPDLEVESKEYQKFHGDSLNLIWRLTRHSDLRVAGSAFRALAQFPPSLHTLDHFPDEIKQMQLQEMAGLVVETDEKDEEDESVIIVHGLCYTRLLQSLTPALLPDFEVFLSALVSHESSNFPRGLTFSASQQQVPRSRALSSIPSFLHDQFESNQKPGARSSLAVGLLFCYDDPPVTGRDGKRGLKNLITRGKNYHDMLYSLINDISIEPSNWYQCVVKVPAWAAFMERCFLVDIESRTAELQLQLEKGECKDPAENQLYQNGAWLWCRDKLTDLIKRSSRGTPAVQSNCVSALAGLALAASNYASRLNPETLRLTEALTEHLRQPHWFTMVAETVLTIIDAGYQSKGRIFPICTQKTSNQETVTQSTILARSSACVSLSLLLPLLTATNVEMVYAALNLLLALCPGKAADTVSDVLQMHSGIGLGLAINKLLGEHFVDIAASQGTTALWNAIHNLEESAFGSSTAKSGSLVGYAICLGALCVDVRLDSRSYIRGVRDRLLTALDGFSSSDKSQESLPLCLAVLSGSSFVANITTFEVVDEDCKKLERILDGNSSNAELCRAVGTLYFILQSANHPNMKDLIRRRSSSWKSILEDGNLAEEDKVAALTGLTSLVGCHRIVMLIPNEGSSIISEIGLENDVIRILKSSQSSCSSSIQKTGAWLTGLLYLATADMGSRQAAVPTNYHFLSQTSILRPLVDLLIEFSKKGLSDVENGVVHAILSSLTKDGTRPFPPLNWSAILGPILRMPIGPTIEELCLRLAIQQSAFLPNLASFLSSCLVAPFYNGLKSPAKVCIYRNLHILIRVIPVTILKEYFENGFLEPLKSLSDKNDERTSISSYNYDLWTLLTAMLKGLQMALKEPSPAQNVPLVLWKAFETICNLCPVENARLWHLCCKCMQFAPESLMDDITSKELKSDETYSRGLLLRCYLVAIGNQPLVWLNQAIEAVAYNPRISNYSSSLWLLVQAFAACSNGAISESCQPLNRMQWLLELMGHIKNLALEIVPLAAKELSLNKIFRFLMNVFLSAIVSWSDSSAAVLLGLPKHLVQDEFETTDAGTCSKDLGEFLFNGNEELLESILMNLAPRAVLTLFKGEPWNQLTGRLVEWFLTIYDAHAVVEVSVVRKVIRDCLLVLRHENDFKKMSVWSRVLMLK